VVADVMRILQRHGCAHAAAIGAMTGDAPLVRVELELATPTAGLTRRSG